MVDNNMAITKIEPFEGDNCLPTGTFKHPGLPKRKIKWMPELKMFFQSIVDSYVEILKRYNSDPVRLGNYTLI
jgi:hypothetical protein